ncbi:MAG: EF-hand domain-containing protein [Syntrophorhabdaceae bacterium]|nr:EF-hand domain-containing protein [Syntrophorhabdaceae bacterium]
MKRIFFLPMLTIFLSSTIVGCSLDAFFSPNYGNLEYPTTSLPGQEGGQQKQPVADQPQRVTAPDEEAKLGPTPRSAARTVKDESIDGSPVVRMASGSMTRVKTASRSTFTGSVTAVDYVGKTISVKSTGKNLTFDLTNPVVRGYANIGEIQIGDTITLGYIKNGIGIVKGENFHPDLQNQTAPDELASSRKGKRSKRATANQSSKKGATPVRVKYKVNRLAFNDVDNNKDGKVSPVELGTVLPSLTMEDFKKYDRNGDGGLNEAEYGSVKKR